jgi:hypothetical protein
MMMSKSIDAREEDEDGVMAEFEDSFKSFYHPIAKPKSFRNLKIGQGDMTAWPRLPTIRDRCIAAAGRQPYGKIYLNSRWSNGRPRLPAAIGQTSLSIL